MASCKVIRQPALLHHAIIFSRMSFRQVSFTRVSFRQVCLSHKEDVVQPDHFQERSYVQLLVALESHVSGSGKELLAGIKDLLASEKETLSKEVEHHKELLASEKEKLKSLKETIKGLKDQRAIYQLELMGSKGVNDTHSLLERMQEVLVANVGVQCREGSTVWEAILNAKPTLRLCIEKHTGIKDVAKQAAHCYTIYGVLSQHVHAGKELAMLQVAEGKILFQRGPMSPEQVQIYLCIGQAANFDIAEDLSTEYTCYSCIV